MNRIIAIIAIALLLLVLFKGLSHAWLGMRALSFIFVIGGFVGLGWLWGKFTR
jgi:hypothetical protein